MRFMCGVCFVPNLFSISCLKSLANLLFPAVSKNDFRFNYVIGKGSLGKVWKVEHRKQRKLYAMKEMSKARIIVKRSVNSVLNEKKFLVQLHHP